ncbi:MAG: transketolase [Eubacteriales bacterium SKADARSKE-1]|nr:transketolase [Eubacteriales bacterium SKADARSKE-1]
MDLNLKCLEIRKKILTTIGTLGVGHIGGSLSIVEPLVVLYEKHMNIDPKNPKMEGRDRLIVSKGHSGPAVYAMLCDKGYFDESWLLTLNKPGTNLPSHCDMNKTPGIDMTTGSLGQGFSCAMGIAKASKIRKDGATIYTIIGDGESQEGQIWEAAMFGAQQKLDNVIAFTDYNKLQLDGALADICDIAPLDDKWRAFGWNVIAVKNGNDCGQIDRAIIEAKKADKPSMIILNTIKGKGISFVENAGVANHSMPISPEMVSEGMAELEGKM